LAPTENYRDYIRYSKCTEGEPRGEPVELSWDDYERYFTMNKRYAGYEGEPVADTAPSKNTTQGSTNRKETSGGAPRAPRDRPNCAVCSLLGNTKGMHTHPTEKCHKLNDTERAKVIKDGSGWIDDRSIGRIKKRLDEAKKVRDAYQIYEDEEASETSETSEYESDGGDYLTDADFAMYIPDDEGIDTLNSDNEVAAYEQSHAPGGGDTIDSALATCGTGGDADYIPTRTTADCL